MFNLKKMQKIAQYIRRLFKYYFFSTKKLETQWNLYMGNFQKKPHKIWKDAEGNFAKKGRLIKKLR